MSGYKNFAKNLLKILIATIMLPTLIADVLTPSGMKRKYLRKKMLKKEGASFSNRQFSRTLSRLKSKKVIAIKENEDGEEVITITKKGYKKIFRYNFDKLKIPKPKKWDGFWRIIIYDIPVKKRSKYKKDEKKARDALRDKLKQLGFFPLQKSVFVHPYPCENEVEFVAMIFDVSQYVNIILAKKIGKKEEVLKDRFHLP